MFKPEHKPGLIAVNLQLFAEGEEEVVDQPVDEPEQQEEFDYSPFLGKMSEKMVYNGEPVTVESIDQLVEMAQKGMNYDKVFEAKTAFEQQLQEAQNNPHLAFLTDLAKKQGFDDLDAYQQAVNEHWKQQERNELIQNNIPEHLADEILENRNFRNQYSQEKESRDAQEAQSKMISRFSELFPEVQADQIPESVLEAVRNGADLSAEYAIYVATHLDEVKQQTEQETLKKLDENAETSPGSINDNAGVEGQDMTIEQIERVLTPMTSQERTEWIKKNYAKIERSGYFSQ